MLATYNNENKSKAIKKLFSYTKEKINNNLEIITIILNILLIFNIFANLRLPAREFIHGRWSLAVSEVKKRKGES